MYDVEKIGRIITKRRRELRLTQEALAARLHISPQAISKWETNAGYPDLSLIPALAEALSLTPGELFGSEYGEVQVAESFEGLPLVQARENLALYSEKEVLRKDEGMVYFTDGSEANFFTRTVINTGRGELRFVQAERIPKPSTLPAAAPLERSFGEIRSLSIHLGMCCKIKILRGEGGITRVAANGSVGFLGRLNFAVNGETLSIGCESGENNHGETKNTLEVYCGFSMGQQLKLHINGSDGASVEPDFASGEICINGSGDVRAKNFDTCLCQINGSGALKFDGTEKNFDVHINGSGDVSCERTGSASIKIAGSGSVTIGECSDSLSVRISGSGDVKVAGEVDTLNVQVSGSGNLNGEGLTAGEAEFRLTGGTDITVGRILRRSVEQLGKNCDLKVLHRG